MSTQTLVTDAELTQALGELEQSAEAVPSLDPPADEQAGSARKLRFKIGGKPSADGSEDAAATGAGEAAPGAAAEAGAAPLVAPRISLAKRVYRMADALIERINRPFGFLPPQVRNALGAAALTTIGTSLAALMVLPILMPNRDALTFLEQLRSGPHTRHAVQASALTQASQVAEPAEPDAGEALAAEEDGDLHASASAWDW